MVRRTPFLSDFRLGSLLVDLARSSEDGQKGRGKPCNHPVAWTMFLFSLLLHGTPELGDNGSILPGPCRGSVFEACPDVFCFGGL